MSKIDRNIDAYDRLMLRTSQLKECQAELTALRAWKAKARPFLKADLRQFIFLSEIELNEERAHMYGKAINELTELLGGSDE